MSGKGAFVFAVFAVALTVVGVAGIRAAGEPDLTDVSGTVVASCATLLQTRPVPEVFTVEGEHLPGTPSVSDTLGSGPCRATFLVQGIARHDRYRVKMGTMSAVVSDVIASGGVTLSDQT